MRSNTQTKDVDAKPRTKIIYGIQHEGGGWIESSKGYPLAELHRIARRMSSGNGRYRVAKVPQ